MAPGLRTQMESHFGEDFNQVRVHADTHAGQAAERIGAKAYTVGQDVVFGRGRYAPDTGEGKRLLAHELAHVVQQRQGPTARPGGPVHEQAADRAAQTLGHDGRGLVNAGPAAAIGVQCEPLSSPEIAALTPAQLRSHIAENERASSVMVNSPGYSEQLARENIELKERANAQMRGELTAHSESATPVAPSPVVDAMAQIRAELAEVDPMVVKLAIDARANPRNHALNEVRGLDARLKTDENVLRDFELHSGPMSQNVHEAAVRVATLRRLLAPAVGFAAKWHDDNPAGKSLGMWNEEQGTRLAGKGLEQFEKGGFHYLAGGAAFTGAFVVAFADAGEKMFSFGVHDTATAVSQAYTRGDISWHEGDQIMRGAISRALIIAAVTRGIGAATSRIGALSAQALKLAPEATRFGVIAGGVSGALTGAAALGTQSLLTRTMEGWFKSPQAKAIWSEGMPKGRDWAIAIPLGILLGSLGGARAVQASNEQLLGSVVNTPSGPMKILAITKGGNVVMEPVGGGLKTPPPPPPETDLVMTYNPASGAWEYQPGSGSGLTPVPVETSPPPSTSTQLARSSGGARTGAGAATELPVKAGGPSVGRLPIPSLRRPSLPPGTTQMPPQKLAPAAHSADAASTLKPAKAPKPVGAAQPGKATTKVGGRLDMPAIRDLPGMPALLRRMYDKNIAMDDLFRTAEELIDFVNKNPETAVARLNEKINIIEVHAQPQQAPVRSKMDVPYESAPPERTYSREEALGRTPQKDSAVGKRVIDRMRGEKNSMGESKIRVSPSGEQEFWFEPTKRWYKVELADMGHVQDAILWWNEEGHRYGLQSKPVRDWMNNPDNYELQPLEWNRSQGGILGGKLRGQGLGYRPPHPDPIPPELAPDFKVRKK